MTEGPASNKLLGIAFEMAAVGFSLTDRKGQFLKVNQAFSRITGFSDQELYSKDFQSITHAEDLPANLEGMRRLLTGEINSLVCEKRYITKSGEVVWVQNSVATIPGENGVAWGFVALTEDVTERKRAEERLRESEDRYRDLVEHSQDLICTHDTQGILLSVNEAPLRILGYSREELLNKPLRDLVTPETRPLCDAYLAQVQRDGFAKGLLAVLTKSGEVRLWEYNNSVRTEGVGSPIVRGIAHDVTEQKHAERALLQSEEKFSKAFRSSPIEMAITTLEDGRFLEVNESFERNTGYRREEVLGRSALDLGLWVDPADRAAIVADIKKNKRVANREIQIGAKSGEIGSKLYSAELIRIGSQQCLLSVSKDITELKRAREQLQRNVALLVEGQRLTRTGSWTWNPVSGELSGSWETYRIFEFEPTAAKPTLELFLRFVHPEDRAKVEQALKQVALHKRDFALDYRIVPPNGAVKNIHSKGRPVFEPSGKLIEFIGTVMDVTERKQTEEELRRLSGQLLRLQDEERREIARELHGTTGQSLCALTALLSQLRSSIRASNRKLKSLIGKCESLTKQCLQEVRTLSYILFPPTLEKAGIASAIRDYVSGFVKRTGIKVKLEVPPSLPRMPREIELVLFRVVQESLVNIHLHSGSHTAAISLNRKPGLVFLEVRDKGRGMPRLKGKESGTVFLTAGVGIPSMVERVQHIGGRLNIESSQVGTAVRVTVPTDD